MYIEGGIRACEIGSVMFAHADPKTGQVVYPKLELVRLAIPRRMYTQSHFDYVVDILKEINGKKSTLRGYKINYQAPLMRHFTAKFEPLGDDNCFPGEKVMESKKKTL